LYDDVQAAASVSRAIARSGNQEPATRVAAVERGRREKPDGTIEDYERVEFEGR
jgi:hypothetical protein